MFSIKQNFIVKHIGLITSFLVSIICVLLVVTVFLVHSYLKTESHLMHLAEVRKYIGESHLAIENLIISQDERHRQKARSRFQQATEHVAHLAVFDVSAQMDKEAWAKKVAEAVALFGQFDSGLDDVVSHDEIYVHAELALADLESVMLDAFATIQHRLVWLGIVVLLSIAASLLVLVMVVSRFQRMQKVLLRKATQHANNKQLIIDSVREGVLIIDESLRIRFANKPMKVLLASDQEQMAKLNIVKRLFDQVQQPIPKRFFEDNAGKTQELVLCDLREEFIPVELSIEYYEEDGRHYLLIFRDLRMQKLAERALIRAKENAEEGDKVKSSFIATISHELRTPLNGIMGMLQLLQDADVNDRDREYIEASMQASTTLLALLNDVLDFSKIEAMKLELHPEPTDVRAILRGAKLSFEPTAVRKNIRIDLDIDPQLPALLYLDGLRLQQVVNNLLSNAVKFTQKGGVSLGVAVLSVEGEYASVRFQCKDTGIGISDSQQQQLFRPFYQASGADRIQAGGTGLGLAISQRLVELMGSSIKLESESQRGATFYFDLTLKVQVDRRINRA